MRAHASPTREESEALPPPGRRRLAVVEGHHQHDVDQPAVLGERQVEAFGLDIAAAGVRQHAALAVARFGLPGDSGRREERRVGTEGVRPYRYRWERDH